MAKTQYVCMSNAIILDRRLKPSAVRVMSALLRFRRSNGTASVTLERLAATANCSVHTVQSAVRSLADNSYLTVEANYRRVGLDALRTTNIYHITAQDMTKGYTQIPVKLCAAPITHAAYLVGCYLFKLIGVGKRAFPSLRKGFEKSLGLARTTVIAAIRQLVSNGFFYILSCRKANRAMSMNSYCVCAWGESIVPQAEVFPEMGGLIFAKPCIIPKITDRTYQRKKRIIFYIRKTILKLEGQWCPPWEDYPSTTPPPAAADPPPMSGVKCFFFRILSFLGIQAKNKNLYETS